MIRLPSRLLLFATWLALTLPAAPARAAAPPPPPPPRVEIECPLFQGGSGSAFYLKAAREYEKLRPDVKVNLYLDPRIQDKVQVRFLEGSFPECSNVGMNYWPLIHNGDAMVLDPFLDGPSWDTVDAAGKPVSWRDTFLPGSLDTFTEDGKHYGIPLGYYASVIWYNKKLFRENGWTVQGRGRSAATGGRADGAVRAREAGIERRADGVPRAVPVLRQLSLRRDHVRPRR